MRRLSVIVAAALLVACATALVAHAADANKKMTREDANAPCSCFGWPAVDVDGDGVLDRYDNCPGTPKGCVVDQWGCSVDSDGDGVCDGLDQCPDTPKGVKVDKQGCSAEQRMASGSAERAPTPAPRAPEPQTPPSPPPAPTPPPATETERQLMTGNLVLENVYFETNSAKLKPESEATLNELGQALEKMPGLRVEIQGHTDSKGAAAYNMKLSQARAESVRQYLLDHFKLNGDDIVPKGYGETRLRVKPERTAEDYAKNRRVEVKVLNPDALPKGVKVEEKR